MASVELTQGRLEHIVSALEGMAEHYEQKLEETRELADYPNHRWEEDAITLQDTREIIRYLKNQK